MKKGITLRCEICKSENYRTIKNKKNTPNKIVLKKYCYKCNSTQPHKEKK